MPEPAPPSLTHALADIARRLSGRVGRASLGMVSLNISSLAATLYVSRTLGVEGYGLFGLGIFFSVQAAQLLQWGLSPLVVRELVREPHEARRILGACLVQRSVTALATLVAGLLLAFTWRGEGGWLLIWLGVADGILVGLTLPAAFDARGRMATYVLAFHLRPLGYLLGAFALHELVPAWYTPQGVLVMHALGIALSLAVEWSWTIRQMGRPVLAGSAPKAWALWRESSPLGLADLAASLLTYASVPAVAWLGHPSETGALNLSNQLAVTLAAVGILPAQALHAHLAARPDPWAPEFRREVLSLTVALSLVAVGACAVVALVAPPLVPLVFGSEYDATGRLLQVDCWRVAGLLGGAALASTLACRRQAGLLAACQALGLVVSVGIAAAFIPTQGAVAASAGASLGRLAALAAMLAAVVASRRPRGLTT